MEDRGGRRRRDREAALGGLLLLLGMLVLAGQALDLELGRVGWPLFVTLPGLGLLGLGLTGDGRPGEVLARPGGVVTMVGLVLLVQNISDRFETWAYAWTLLVVRRRDRTVGGRDHPPPPGPGRRRRLDDRHRAGPPSWLFAVLFEVVIGIGDRSPGGASRYTLAVLLILAGLVLLGRQRADGQTSV